MIYFLLLLIHLSFLGYLNFFRRKLKIHWTNIVFFGACALALLLMLAGILHAIKFATYAIFIGGLLLTLLSVFRKKLNWSLPTKNKVMALFFRPEYLFMYVFSFGGFFIFNSYKVELGRWDIWGTWYQQYYYIASHGCWSDSSFKCFANAYAMGLNGVAYFWGTILHNYGTQVWCYAYYWFAIIMLMPIFTQIKWRNIPLLELLLLSCGLFIYRLYNEQLPILYFLILCIIVLWLFLKFLLVKNACHKLKNSILFALGIILSTYVLSMPMCFIEYPIDTTMGCICVGTLLCFAYGMLSSRMLKRYTYFMGLPLLLLPLVKPTGMILAVLFILLFVPWEVRLFCKKYGIYAYKKKYFLKEFLSIVIIIAAPFISYTAWQYYAASNGLEYQHKVSTGILLKKALHQIENGATTEEIEQWQKKIRRASAITPYSVPEQDRSFIERVIMRKCEIFFGNHSRWDCDTCFRYPHYINSHVAIISFLLVSVFILTLILNVQKKRMLYLMCWMIVSCIFFMFNQYYLAPMFTEIPGIFRYVYPMYVLILAITFYGIFRLFYQNRLKTGIIICGMLIYFLSPHFTAKFPTVYANYKGTPQSEVGRVLLAMLNADRAGSIFFSVPQCEGIMASSFIHKLGIVKSHNVVWELSDKIKKPLLVVLGNRITSKSLSSYKDIAPGMYFANLGSQSQISTLFPVFCNEDAVSLLNETYKFSDPESWMRSPWVEHNLFAQTDKNNWSITDTGKKSVTEVRKVLEIDALEKECIAFHNAKYFFFAYDKIRITGKADQKMPIQLYINIFVKENTDDKSPLRCTIQSKKLDIVWKDSKDNKKEFCAEFDFSDLKIDNLATYYQLKIHFAPLSDGELYDLHLQQYVSGKLNLNLTEIPSDVAEGESAINRKEQFLFNGTDGANWNVFPVENRDGFAEENKVLKISAHEKNLMIFHWNKFAVSPKDKICLIGKSDKQVPLSLTVNVYEKTDENGKNTWKFLQSKVVKFVWQTLEDGQKEWHAELDFSTLAIDKAEFYYQLRLNADPETECELRDLHLYQYDSEQQN